MSAAIPYLLLGPLISIVVVVIFLRQAYRDRKKIDGLEDTVRQYSHLLVENFLQREAQATRQRIKKLAVDANRPPSLEKLRLCWLNAELKSLVDHGRRHSNYLVLQQAALPFLRLFEKKATSAIADAKSIQQKAVLQLQKVRSVVGSQQSALAEFNGRKLSADDATRMHHNPTFTQALGSVEQNTTTLLATINRLETELATMKRNLEAVGGKSSSPEMTSFVISTGVQSANDQRELLEEIKKAYQQTLVEMAHMREINREQRKLILQLENELSLHREDTDQYAASAALLKKLQQQLVDYENCTIILETESDALRERIEAWNKVVEGGASDEDLTQSKSAALPIPISTSASHSEIAILPFIERLLESSDFQRAATQIISLLNGMQVMTSLYIKGQRENIFTSSTGVIDSHSKQLLQSLVPFAGQATVKVKEGYLIAYPMFRVLLHDDEKLIDDLPMLENIMKVIDNVLLLIEARMEQVSWRRGMSDFKNQISALVVQHNYVASEYENIGAKLREEINDYIASLKPSSVQKQCLERMLEDYSVQTKILIKAEQLIQSNLKSVSRY